MTVAFMITFLFLYATSFETVIIRICLISFQLSILYLSCCRVCEEGRMTTAAFVNSTLVVPINYRISRFVDSWI